MTTIETIICSVVGAAAVSGTGPFFLPADCFAYGHTSFILLGDFSYSLIDLPRIGCSGLNSTLLYL